MSLSGLKCILALFAILLCSQPTRAELPLHIDSKLTVVDMGPYLDVLEDSELEFGGGDLFSLKFTEGFKPLLSGSANYGFSESAWWVRFTIVNDDFKPQKATFKLDYPLLDTVDVWVFRGSEQLASWRTGNRRPFGTRPIRHRDFLFPMTLAAKEQQTVFVRVRSEGPVNIGLSLYSEQTLLPEIEMEYMAFGAYFGGFLLLALCIFILYLMDRQEAFLYYLTYILSYSSYMLAFNGLAFQYLWPDAPDFGQVSRPILLSFSTIFLLQFSRKLLGIRKASPLLFKIVTGVQIILATVLIAAPFIGYGLFIMPLAYLNLTVLTLVIVMGVVAHRKGEAAARYYLIAWSVFLAGLLVYLLKVFGILPHNFVTHYGFQIGSIFEFMFLSAALGVRVRDLRHQSHIDGLTGLSNRRSFDLALAEEFSMSTRPEAELSLLVVDVDHFKNFNDTYGHASGDKVLKEIGALFKQHIRRPGQAFRYGGEEFAVLLPRTGKKEALIVAERLRERVSEDLYFVDVTVSIGLVCHSKGRFANAAKFFVAGDKALYDAKKSGRNRVVAYDPERHENEIQYNSDALAT